MKRKMIILFVLSVMVLTLTVGTVGVAFADDIRINLIGDGFSIEEKELAMANLELKFEDREMPTLISVEELYDFNGEPLYGLYEFVDYYMIVIRQTSSIMERGECNSVYFGLEGKKYYGGFGNTYILDDKGYRSLNSDKTVYASEEETEEMKNKMAELRALDYQDYIEALNTPMPLGAGNRNRIKYLANSLVKAEYFMKKLSVNYSSHYYAYDFASCYIKDVLYTYPNFTPEIYGMASMAKFTYGWDLFYPNNVYNDCALVAMVALLQYYERICSNTTLIPFTFGKGYGDYNYIFNNPLGSRSEQLRALLHNYLGTLASNGAATYVNIDAAFNKYFEAYNINWKPTHFTSYTNIKGAVDDGNPSIINVGPCKGWDVNNNEIDFKPHNLLVYAYTTNSIGVLDEFVCHGLWYRVEELKNLDEVGKDEDIPVYTSQLFVSKFYAIGNVHISSK